MFVQKKSGWLKALVLVPLVLFTGAALTSAALFTNISQQKKIAHNDYTYRVNNATEHLDNTIQQHSSLVLAAQALFHASEEVSRREFHSFTESLNVEKFFPNTQALSWNPAVKAEDTAVFQRAVQLDESTLEGGYPEFTVRPETDEKVRYVVTFIEPMKGNEGAFGFDIGSNSDRRTTVELARDTDKLAATAPITLAQESGEQKGFLMMLPVFNSDSSGNVLHNKDEFKGVVVAVFRIGDLISGSGDLTFTSLQVSDVTDTKRGENSEYIFSNGKELTTDIQTPLVRSINVADRQWELVFTNPSKNSISTASNWTIGILGTLATLLAAVFTGYILNSRQRVDQRAALLTVDLQNTNKELQRSNEDLTQFAFVASHDLQTPIRNVLMSVDLLKEELGEDTNSNAREYLKILHRSADRMKRLTSDLLNYARLGNDEIRKTTVDLNTVFKNVERTTLEQCKAENASLMVSDLPTTNADEQQLERVFTNLVENAIRYSHPERPAVIEVCSSHEGNRLKIHVKDNGIGIDSQYHESIFTPFRRLHRQDEVQGSGLGLAICKKIIERHGGSICVESSSDSGTVFSITL